MEKPVKELVDKLVDDLAKTIENASVEKVSDAVRKQAVELIRDSVWTMLDLNDTQRITSIVEYQKRFKNATDDCLPFLRSDKDLLRDKEEKERQAIAMILNGLYLLAETINLKKPTGTNE